MKRNGFYLLMALAAAAVVPAMASEDTTQSPMVGDSAPKAKGPQSLPARPIREKAKEGCADGDLVNENRPDCKDYTKIKGGLLKPALQGSVFAGFSNVVGNTTGGGGAGLGMSQLDPLSHLYGSDIHASVTNLYRGESTIDASGTYLGRLRTEGFSPYLEAQGAGHLNTVSRTGMGYLTLGTGAAWCSQGVWMCLYAGVDGGGLYAKDFYGPNGERQGYGHFWGVGSLRAKIIPDPDWMVDVEGKIPYQSLFDRKANPINAMELGSAKVSYAPSDWGALFAKISAVNTTMSNTLAPAGTETNAPVTTDVKGLKSAPTFFLTAGFDWDLADLRKKKEQAEDSTVDSVNEPAPEPRPAAGDDRKAAAEEINKLINGE